MNRKFIIYAVAIILLCCNRTYAGNENPENIMVKLTENSVQDAVIEIHTYGGEQYTATGSLEVIKAGGDECFLELQGRLEKKEYVEKEKEYFKETHNATSLTVYEGENIYGFYSNRQMEVSGDEDTMKIIMYGYLEAYYDGAVYYSG